MRIEADGMLGAIIASESLGLTDTMINGAGGCRSRAQIMMHELIPSYYPENRECCKSKCFSKQSRLPCTYLNNDDIVFGTAAKVAEGIESVSSITGKRTVLLDTLGASLICTDYSGLTGHSGTDPIFIRGDLSSMTLAEGYDTAMCSILSLVDMDDATKSGINLLGYGIMDLGWEYGADDLCHILELMGVEVNCIPGCMPTSDSVKACGRSVLNVMIHPEYCMGTAEMLKERFGTPYLRPKAGAPVGYPALRAFVREVAEALSVDPSPALAYIDSEAKAVHRVLMNYDRFVTGLYAKGMVMKGDSSVVYPLMTWLMETFGMVPREISFTDDSYRREIEGYLESVGHSEVLVGAEGEVEVVFTDGLTALEGRISRTPIGYVEIRLPRGRTMDLVGRTIVGTRGCRYILDEMFNNITRFRCGQPTGVEYRPGGSDE